MIISVSLLSHQNDHIIVHNVAEEFYGNSVDMNFIFICPLQSWVFEKHNMEPGDNPYLRFDHIGLLAINNKMVIDNDIQPMHVLQDLMPFDYIPTNFVKSHKFNCKKIDAYEGRTKTLSLHGDFKYINEVGTIENDNQVQKIYHVINKEKELILRIVIIAYTYGFYYKPGKTRIG